MNRPLIVFGVGQLGRLFGGAALRLARPVYPITRSMNPGEVWRAAPADTPLLVAVDEASLPEVLASIPPDRRREVILLQNEIFASTWERAGLEQVTALAFWTLCKPGQPQLVGARSAVHGRHGPLVAALHEALDIPCVVLGSERERDAELAAKYALILTINGLGVKADRRVGEWLERGEEVSSLMEEACALGSRLAGLPASTEVSRDLVWGALERMSAMPARGRSAPVRVQRALASARTLGVRVPSLEAIGEGIRGR